MKVQAEEVELILVNRSPALRWVYFFNHAKASNIFNTCVIDFLERSQERDCESFR